MMVELTTRVLSTAECERWNTFVSQSPWGHLMQSWEWGTFKAALGWQVQHIVVERDNQWLGGAQVLIKPLPLLPLSIAYLPKGPVIDFANQNAVTALFLAIHAVLQASRTLFLRIEPNHLDADSLHQQLMHNGFHSTEQTNQPRSTIVVDLNGDEAALWKAMRKTTRKLVRRALRDGVSVEAGDVRDLATFYEILASTAVLKGIPVHPLNFYEQAWVAFQDSGAVHLLLARYQQQILAAKMIFVYGGHSLHFWGGTSELGRKLHASYLIQWEAIKWASAQGCTTSDLWGIPDEIGAMLKTNQTIPTDRSDGLWGVYTFKRGFGGRVEYYVGAYDYVYRPLLYKLGVTLAHDISVDWIAQFLEKITG